MFPVSFSSNITQCHVFYVHWEGCACPSARATPKAEKEQVREDVFKQVCFRRPSLPTPHQLAALRLCVYLYFILSGVLPDIFN